MLVKTSKEIESITEIDEEVWKPPLPPTDLVFDDEEVLESNRHRLNINALIRSVQQAFVGRNDFFTGGNMFIYYSSAQVRNQDYKGPDFFVVLNIDARYARQGWVVWEESGRYPDVIVELMSPSTKRNDLGKKKEIYEKTFRTPDYFVYDPFDFNSLRGWHLNGNQNYEELVPNEQGRLWCASLGFWLGTWAGTIDRENTTWLRFFDSSGNLVLLPEEAERERAQAAQQQAQAAQQQAQAAQQQAEAERERGDRLAAKLREMGLEPDNL